MMVEIKLEPGERLIISSRAQFCNLRRFSQLRTGNAFLTDKRFIFKGRLQIKTLFHLFAVVLRRGKRNFEIHIPSILMVKKRKLDSAVEIVFMKGSKEEKAFMRPEGIPYLGDIVGLGMSALGDKVGQLLGESISRGIGDMAGTAAGPIGGKFGVLTGETIAEIEARSLADTWLKAFWYVARHSTGEYNRDGALEPGSSVQPGTGKKVFPEGSGKKGEQLPEIIAHRMKNKFSVSVDDTHRMEIVSLGQIFEEELGKNFSNFVIPASQIEYFEELVHRVEDARNYRDREMYSEQLRFYLRHLKTSGRLTQRKGELSLEFQD